MNPLALLSAPAAVFIDLDDGAGPRLAVAGATGWSLGQTLVSVRTTTQGLALALESPTAAVAQVLVRWRQAIAPGIRLLGDHWERGYGDLEWRGLVPERVMPWYVLAWDGDLLHGFGVMTQPNAFAHWQVDPAGVALVLDTRAGGVGVRLGQRRLELATVAVREGRPGEDPHAAATAFCRQLCPSPRLPKLPVYGANDWYYAYGNATAATQRRDAALLAQRTAGLTNRPYQVIDGGWYGDSCCAAGPWVPNQRFCDMADLAKDIAAHDIIPGIWVRPILQASGAPESWILQRPNQPNEGRVLDPTLPEVLDQVEDLIRTLVGWGYGLVKHDFSTFDLTGRWGFEMLRGSLTTPDWALRDQGQTLAEAILGLYRAIRRGAGDSCLVLGCNTVSHLAAGLVEIQRTGDDTSGLVWERTRKMGINTLAMRMPQQDTFYAVDADCVGLTSKVPWQLNRQWLGLLARSGTPLFISADPEAVGPEQEAAMRAAFALAATPRPVSQPLDWLDSTAPARWHEVEGERTYDWDDDLPARPQCP